MTTFNYDQFVANLQVDAKKRGFDPMTAAVAAHMLGGFSNGVQAELNRCGKVNNIRLAEAIVLAAGQAALQVIEQHSEDRQKRDYIRHLLLRNLAKAVMMETTPTGVGMILEPQGGRA